MRTRSFFGACVERTLRPLQPNPQAKQKSDRSYIKYRAQEVVPSHHNQYHTTVEANWGELETTGPHQDESTEINITGSSIQNKDQDKALSHSHLKRTSEIGIIPIDSPIKQSANGPEILSNDTQRNKKDNLNSSLSNKPKKSAHIVTPLPEMIHRTDTSRTDRKLSKKLTEPHNYNKRENSKKVEKSTLNENFLPPAEFISKIDLSPGLKSSLIHPKKRNNKTKNVIELIPHQGLDDKYEIDETPFLSKRLHSDRNYQKKNKMVLNPSTNIKTTAFHHVPHSQEKSQATSTPQITKPKLNIGRIEVEVVMPPVAQKPTPVKRSSQPLSKGYLNIIGLSQM